MNTEKNILVYADLNTFDSPQLIGILHSSILRAKEVFSFEYDKNWLKLPFAYEIDPDLELFSGYQYLRNEKPNFGVFLDSAPDRWGRVLMERRESILARIENRPRQNLREREFFRVEKRDWNTYSKDKIHRYRTFKNNGFRQNPFF